MCSSLRRPLLAALLLSCGASALYAQTPDSLRTERLAALGRLYGVVRFFHPALAERSVAWDSSTAVAIEGVRAAANADQYAAAVRSLLRSLDDPATRLELPGEALKATTAQISTRWEASGSDSAFVVVLPNFDDFNAVQAALRAAATNLRVAPRIIFDLRGPAPAEGGTAEYVFEGAGTNRLLTATTVSGPALRFRLYSGFAPEEGTSSGGYWTGSYEISGAVFTPLPNTPARRIVFLVNPWTDLPSIAFALRNNGQGAVVVEGENGFLSSVLPRYGVPMGDGLVARVRIGSIVGTSQADTVIEPRAGDNAIRVAHAWAQRPVTAPAPIVPAALGNKPVTPELLPRAAYPSAGYRVLAAYRWWNTIFYFFPYTHLIGEDWNRVLPQSIARLESARDSLDYALGVAEIVTHINDSHGSVRSPALFNYFGMSTVGVQLQYIAGSPVVISVVPDSATRASGIAVGDVIVSVDGEDATARKKRLARYIAHSTPQALDASVAQRLLMGPEGSARVTVRGVNQRSRELEVPRRANLWPLLRFERTGPVMKMLPGNIGYADLSRLRVADVDSMFELFRNTRAIIFDGRGYPQGTAWSIAPRLTDKPVAAARFQRPLRMSPDTSAWDTHQFVQYTPPTDKWRYKGRTVHLVDERTISQAEHTGLFFEAANKTTFIGSATMGANGDVTFVQLPGGLVASFTGHDVRHADGRQLQRIGLQPHIVVRPTLAGIRAGRDEVLERALEFLRTR